MQADAAEAKVRPPAVAGTFYPAEPERLRTQVRHLLARARQTDGPPPKALIAPHAGYLYSGAVAGAAFSSLREDAARIRRVVLIGPAHYVAFRGIAVPTARAFATPLGQVPVDSDSLGRLADLRYVVRADPPHAPEHALEVELPYLQIALGDFGLVPLLVGDAAAEEAEAVLERLWGGEETLIVVSSDLSHYLDYATAQHIDAATAALIEAGAAGRLGPERACGHLAIAGLLSAASRRGLAARRLALCNSGDTAGARDRVVGYGAWRFDPPRD